MSTYAVTGPRQWTQRFSATADERTFEQEYIVESDNMTDNTTPRQIAAGLGTGTLSTIPAFGSTLSGDTKMHVTGITVEFLPDQIENPNATGTTSYFRVVVQWSSKAAPVTDSDGGYDDPTAAPDDIRVNFARRSEPIYRAYHKSQDGTPTDDGTVNTLSEDIVNSALQSFDPPLEEDAYDLVVTVTRNKDFTDAEAASHIQGYTGRVNKSTFWGFDPHTCLCEIDGEKVQLAGAYYYRMTYRIIIRDTASGWDRELVDMGTHIKVTGASTGFQVITDWLGLPVEDPVPLDGTGSLRAPAATGDLKTITFRTRKTANFAALSLPAFGT